MNNPKDYHKTWSPKSTTRLSPKLKKLKKKIYIYIYIQHERTKEDTFQSLLCSHIFVYSLLYLS